MGEERRKPSGFGSMPEWLATFDTDEITCPWCKATVSDSWEVESEGEDDEVCSECGGAFSWERRTTVKYDSRKVEADDEDVSGAP